MTPTRLMALAAVALSAPLLLTACGQPTPQTPCGEPWSTAKSGSYGEFEGEVADFGSDPDTGTVFANIGHAYPDGRRLTLVLYPNWENEHGNDFSDLTVGGAACFGGNVTTYRGAKQIELDGDAYVYAK